VYDRVKQQQQRRLRMEETEAKNEIPILDLSTISSTEILDIDIDSDLKQQQQPTLSSPKPSKEPKVYDRLEFAREGSLEEGEERPVNKALKPLTKREEEIAKFVLRLLRI
jgi:hypothetical protein